MKASRDFFSKNKSKAKKHPNGCFFGYLLLLISRIKMRGTLQSSRTKRGGTCGAAPFFRYSV